MKLLKNYSLKNNNTFRVDVKSKYYSEVNDIDELKEILGDGVIEGLPILLLGDGANILFTKDFEGLVLKVQIKGINILEENTDSVVLEIGAGEKWDGLVKFCVDKKYGGIENMAMIPGLVGAAAAGNIAAYNQNLVDVFESLDAIDLADFRIKTFSKQDCEFKYRESIFKGKLMNKFLITKVRIKLDKKYKLNISYFETGKTYAAKGSLEEELQKIAKQPYTINDIYNAVSNIRKMKLPDPKKIGTAGSFFKNPVVTKEKYEELKKNDPDLQCYPVDKLTYPKLNDPSLTYADYVKIPVARLFDNLGWKGKRIGNVGTFPTQALNVVAYEGATGDEILKFTKEMEKDLYKTYKIKLEKEVIVI